MKTKLTFITVLLSICASAAEIGWTPSPPEEQVTKYLLEHRLGTETNWTRVEVAGNLSSVVIPETAFGRWFRIAPVNSFGQGEWTTPTRLPNKLPNLQLLKP